MDPYSAYGGDGSKHHNPAIQKTYKALRATLATYSHQVLLVLVGLFSLTGFIYIVTRMAGISYLKATDDIWYNLVTEFYLTIATGVFYFAVSNYDNEDDEDDDNHIKTEPQPPKNEPESVAQPDDNQASDAADSSDASGTNDASDTSTSDEPMCDDAFLGAIEKIVDDLIASSNDDLLTNAMSDMTTAIPDVVATTVSDGTILTTDDATTVDEDTTDAAGVCDEPLQKTLSISDNNTDGIFDGFELVEKDIVAQ